MTIAELEVFYNKGDFGVISSALFFTDRDAGREVKFPYGRIHESDSWSTKAESITKTDDGRKSVQRRDPCLARCLRACIRAVLLR